MNIINKLLIFFPLIYVLFFPANILAKQNNIQNITENIKSKNLKAIIIYIDTSGSMVKASNKVSSINNPDQKITLKEASAQLLKNLLINNNIINDNAYLCIRSFYSDVKPLYDSVADIKNKTNLEKELNKLDNAKSSKDSLEKTNFENVIKDMYEIHTKLSTEKKYDDDEIAYIILTDGWHDASSYQDLETTIIDYKKKSDLKKIILLLPFNAKNSNDSNVVDMKKMFKKHFKKSKIIQDKKIKSIENEIIKALVVQPEPPLPLPVPIEEPKAVFIEQIDTCSPQNNKNKCFELKLVNNYSKPLEITEIDLSVFQLPFTKEEKSKSDNTEEIIKNKIYNYEPTLKINSINTEQPSIKAHVEIEKKYFSEIEEYKLKFLVKTANGAISQPYIYNISRTLPDFLKVDNIEKPKTNRKTRELFIPVTISNNTDYEQKLSAIKWSIAYKKTKNEKEFKAFINEKEFKPIEDNEKESIVFKGKESKKIMINYNDFPKFNSGHYKISVALIGSFKSFSRYSDKNTEYEFYKYSLGKKIFLFLFFIVSLGAIIFFIIKKLRHNQLV